MDTPNMICTLALGNAFDLWVDGEKPWPFGCAWTLVVTKQIHHITNKIVVDKIIV
jgi:hypothetical protein